MGNMNTPMDGDLILEIRNSVSLGIVEMQMQMQFATSDVPRC
jgi:hypothetical protein